MDSATHGHTGLTQEQTEARQALDQAAHAGLAADRDRLIHGIAVAAFGLAIGAYVVLNRVAANYDWLAMVLLPAYVVTLGALAWWQSRAARTVPRHSRRIGYVGLAASVVLMLGAVVWLNVRQGDNRTAGLPDQLESWWLYLVVAVVIALPMLVAGHLIQRGRK